MSNFGKDEEIPAMQGQYIVLSFVLHWKLLVRSYLTKLYISVGIDKRYESEISFIVWLSVVIRNVQKGISLKVIFYTLTVQSFPFPVSK